MKTFWLVFDLLAVVWTTILASILTFAFVVNYWFYGLPIARIRFDVVGEAFIESIVFPIWCVMGVVTFIRMMRKAKRELQQARGG